MALALRRAAPLSPDVVLGQAISEFESLLTTEQRATFRGCRTQALRSAPRPEDVMRLTAEINIQFRGKSSRCLGPRFTSVLQTIQQYASLGDIVVGSSQNILACSLWAVVRLSLQMVVGLTSYLERISVFFMDVGRSSPRYQSMAMLYPRSANIRAYLANYFIVITRVCQHFVSFSQKSLLAQLAASLDESRLRDARAELDKWSNCIREEVDFLATQTIEVEAKENTSFRALIGLSHTSDAKRRRLKRQLKFIESCSAIDFETPWKQARKLGNSTVFTAAGAIYQNWRDSQDPGTSMLVLMGKLGSGKTVTMANILDDVHLCDESSAAIYFFCRHDMAESLTARAVVSCLLQQLLRACLQDSAMDDLNDDFRAQPSLDYMLRMVEKVFPHQRRIRCIIDGLDECPGSEAVLTLQWIRQLRTKLNFRCCISVRSGTNHENLVSVQNLGASWATIHMPDGDTNPDIAKYINTELESCCDNGQLKIGDPYLILEIRNALLRGANGMFLWVTLQIQSLCQEESDDAIRAALHDLPTDLYTTYKRILTRGRTDGNRRINYQERILKLVTAAFRPMTIDELREAVSVSPGDTTWQQNMLVNDFRSTLRCCGSLIMVDEEELSVRLIHDSVLQFLTSLPVASGSESMDTICHFSPEEAQVYMGEVAITYLNYGIFETRVSTNRVPTVPAGQLTDRVLEDSLPGGARGKWVRMLLGAAPGTGINESSVTPPGLDFGRAIAEVRSHQRQKLQKLEDSPFLTYASKYWLPHTSWIHNQSINYQLWLKVLENPRFNTLSWANDQNHTDDLVVKQDTGSVWQVSPRTSWSISHDHMALLRTELAGKRWARGFASIMPYLHVCYNRSDEIRPVFSARMATKLLGVAVLSRSMEITQWLLSMGASLLEDEYRVLRGLINRRQYKLLDAILGCFRSDLPVIGQLEDITMAFACEAGDARLVYRLLHHGRGKGFNTRYYYNSPSHMLGRGGLLKIVLDNTLCNPSNLLIAFRLFDADSFHATHSTMQNVYQLLLTSHSLANPQFFNPVNLILNAGASNGHCDNRISIGRQLLEDALVHACLRGDGPVAQTLLDSGLLLCKNKRLKNKRVKECLDAALFAKSHGRTELALQILSNKPPRRFPLRCIQLRDWALAAAFELTDADRTNIQSYIWKTSLMHLCADAGDLEGLEFLVHNVRLDINQCYNDQTTRLNSGFGRNNILQTALKGPWATVEALHTRIKTIDGLVEMGADSTIRAGSFTLPNRPSCFDLMLQLCRDATDHIVALHTGQSISYSERLGRETAGDIAQIFHKADRLLELFLAHVLQRTPLFVIKTDRLINTLQKYVDIIVAEIYHLNLDEPDIHKDQHNDQDHDNEENEDEHNDDADDEDLRQIRARNQPAIKRKWLPYTLSILKSHHLKSIQLLLQHQSPNNKTPKDNGRSTVNDDNTDSMHNDPRIVNFIRENADSLGGVPRKLLESHGFDVSQIPCQDLNSDLLARMVREGK